MELYDAYCRWVHGIIENGHEGVFWSEQLPDGTRSFRFGLGAAKQVAFDEETEKTFFWTNYSGRKLTAVRFEGAVLPEVTYDLKALPTLSVEGLTDHIQTKPGVFQQNVQIACVAAHAGDIWVVNLAHQLSGSLPDEQALLSSFGAFLGLNRPHRGGAVWTKTTKFASFSPEAFITVHGRTITTSPIKGTGTRDYLENSKKEKAELMMVTDLLRNDLGMICESVRVQTLRHIFPVGDFHHAQSVIQGTMTNSQITERDYKKLLPAGSITGAPKRRACEMIEALEEEPRGLYTGTFGWKTKNELKSSILIRTLFAEGNKWKYGTGAGITHASDPESEWAETLEKAALLRMLSA